MADTKLTFDIFAKDRASKTFQSVGKEAGKTSRILGGLGKGAVALGKAAAFGLAGGVVAGGLALKGFISEAEESRRVTKLTASVIKSTGGAAKVTAKQVSDLSTAISNKTGVDDEAIQSGSNLLLTFKNVRNEVGKGAKIFDRATQAAVDLSAAGFGDIAGASKMLGKALNDPIKGITALSRAGVTFTDQQKKQITAMVKAGDVLGAQKIILKEVESQVGGAAAATGTATDKLRVILGNMGEQIGGYLLPIVDKAATWLGKVLPKALDVVGKYVGDFTSGVQGASDNMGGFRGVAQTAGQKVRELADWFSTRAIPALKDFAGWIKTNVIPVVRDFAGWVANSLVPAIRKAAADVLPKLQATFRSVADTVRNNQPTFQKIGDVLRAVGVVVTSVVIPAWGKLYGAWIGSIGPMFKALVQVVDKVVIPAIRTMTDIWFTMVGALVNGAAKAFGWVKGIGGKLKNAAKEFNTFRDNVNNALNGIHNKTVAVTLQARGQTQLLSGKFAGKVIPLAEGGVVKAKRGGTLALIGEAGHDEAVVPLSGPNAPRRGGAAGGGNIYITVSALDPKGAADAVLRALAQAQHNHGGSLPMIRTATA